MSEIILENQSILTFKPNFINYLKFQSWVMEIATRSKTDLSSEEKALSFFLQLQQENKFYTYLFDILNNSTFDNELINSELLEINEKFQESFNEITIFIFNNFPMNKKKNG